MGKWSSKPKYKAEPGKKKSWRVKKAMGKGAIECAMGILNNDSNIYGWDSIFSFFWVRVVVPMEIGLPSLKVEQFDPQKNEETLKLSIVLLEEHRETT